LSLTAPSVRLEVAWKTAVVKELVAEDIRDGETMSVSC
jgi:hypothetical protein